MLACPSRLFNLVLPVRRSFSLYYPSLSGHNKWSKIKQKKGLMDAQKSSIYGKSNRDIVIAVRNGGSADADKNATLAAVLKRAKALGVPKDNIDTALRKAVGNKDKGNQNLTYEVLAQGSVGVIIECLTDNTNRTLHNIREILNAHNARFAPVGFMFERTGYVRVGCHKRKNTKSCVEQLIETALESSAVDFEELNSTEELIELAFTCPTHTLGSLTAAVTAPGKSNELLASELIYTPVEEANSPDVDLETKVTDLVNALEENEDTLRVWTTLDT